MTVSDQGPVATAVCTLPATLQATVVLQEL